MSQESVAVVQSGLERLLAGDVPWEMLDEDLEVHDHDTLDQGQYKGHVGFRRWIEDWGTAWADWSIEPEEFIDAGAQVVVVLRMRAKGRGSGVELDRQDAIVYVVRYEKITRFDYYNSKRQAVEAVGLKE